MREEDRDVVVAVRVRLRQLLSLAKHGCAPPDVKAMHGCAQLTTNVYQSSFRKGGAGGVYV